MHWWQNIPFFSILLLLPAAALSSVLKRRAARALTLGLLGLSLVMSVLLLFEVQRTGASFTYRMGHFPAPWGNEIRCGPLEALLSVLVLTVMLLALWGGGAYLPRQVGEGRESLYYTICDLLTAALLTQVYSNDLFTCYVFLEIMTLTACALIISRDTNLTLVSAMRYMVLNLAGSGFFLLGVVLLYDITGHLLMEHLGESVRVLQASGAYRRPLTVIVALITTGLCTKSALFPFHTWVSDAYSNSTPASNILLSSLVSKGYIFLLLKIYCRVFGWDLVLTCGIDRLLMVFALLGMIVGSLRAIRMERLTRMISWSSVAQIGYIYLGVSLGAGAGYQAAVFHLLVHAVAKTLLFLGGAALEDASGQSLISRMGGAARRNPVAGVCWTLGACTLVGLPFTGGLISKLLLGQEALRHSLPVALAVLAVLAWSTVLNVRYFLRAALIFWSPAEAPVSVLFFREAEAGMAPAVPARARFQPVLICLALLCVALFFFSTPLLSLIDGGLALFS